MSLVRKLVQTRDVSGDLDQGGDSGNIERWLDFGHNSKEVLTLLLKCLLIKRGEPKITARILV